ncbi:MAG: hypothetical protein ACYTFK_11575 [Planctomycetota bacterium]|jgi:hypothetical protein
MNELDRSKPYGKVIGDPEVFFKQGGYDYDSTGKLIPGSRNSAPAMISNHIEEISEAEPPKPVYEDMHVHALKRHATIRYAELEAAGVEFEVIEPGKGMQQRLIDFLNET